MKPLGHRFIESWLPSNNHIEQCGNIYIYIYLVTLVVTFTFGGADSATGRPRPALKVFRASSSN